MSGLGASIGAGIARGAAATQQYVREQPLRDARLAEARSRQELSKLQLEEFKGQAGNRTTTSELQLRELQNRVAQQDSEALKRTTYEAFRSYNSDGDVRHLNNFLSEAKKNPQGKQMWGGYARFDSLSSLDPDTAKRLLNSAGIDSTKIKSTDKSNIGDNYIVETGANGEQRLLALDKLQASTGYTQYMTKVELQQQAERARLHQLIAGPDSAETNLIRDIATEKDIPLLEAAKLYKQSTKATSGSALERIAANIRVNNPQMSEEESIVQAKRLMSSGSETEREARLVSEQENISYTQALEKVNARKERTAPRKQLDEAATVRTQLDSLSKDNSFFSLDLSDPVQRRKAGPLVTELEKLTGKELTTEDKRLARQVRELTALGNRAGTELTAEETGILDSMLKTVRRYISDEVDVGDKGIAAYEQYRNVLRNALYGATLSGTENRKFEAAMGNLGQKAGPVLSQLNESMRSLKDKLQAIYDTSDEHVAYYYLGKGLDEVDQAIEAIDDRLASLDKLQVSKSTELITPEVAPKPKLTPEEQKKKFDEIFGGSIK